MKIYHYASPDDWRAIQKGSWQSRDEPGLGACLRVCKVNYEDEESTNGAVFGLLEPEPENWVNNAEFPVAWQYLTSNVGRLLLTYEPSDELIDKSFIIDWSHRERLHGGHKDDLGSSSKVEASFEERLVAEKAYWASRIPLSDYIESPHLVSELILPEVISMCTVPASLIEIADQQPRLLNLSPLATENLNFAISQNPELEVLSCYIDS